VQPPARSPAVDPSAGTAVGDPQNVNPHPAMNSTEPSTPVVPARPAAESSGTEGAAHATPPAAEHRVEARFRAADLDGMGLTREQMAKNFPLLADRFDAMDTDRNGRVEASELMAALQHMTPQARETQ
jgi:EF hand